MRYFSRYINETITETVVITDLPEAIGGELVLEVEAIINIEPDVNYRGLDIISIKDQKGNDITSKLGRTRPDWYNYIQEHTFDLAVDRLGV